MATPLFQKLKIKEKDVLLTLHAPDDFKKALGTLPKGVSITTSGNSYNQVHWFVLNKAQMEKEVNRVLKMVKQGTIVWVYYPKSSSKLQTDLNRDKGWESLLQHGDKLTWISLISFNDTWSVFGFRQKTEADKKKEAKPKAEREVYRYVDPVTREVSLPDDLAAALKKNKSEAGFFETLSFTNKKEYIEWIVTAKREETRTERVTGTIARLKKNWKNPRNQ